MDNSFGVGQIDADNFGIVNCHAVYIGKSGEINRSCLKVNSVHSRHFFVSNSVRYVIGFVRVGSVSF